MYATAGCEAGIGARVAVRPFESLVVGVYQYVVSNQPENLTMSARPSGSVLELHKLRRFPATSSAADRSLSLLLPRSNSDQSRRRYRVRAPFAVGTSGHAGFGVCTRRCPGGRRGSRMTRSCLPSNASHNRWVSRCPGRHPIPMTATGVTCPIHGLCSLLTHGSNASGGPSSVGLIEPRHQTHHRPRFRSPLVHWREQQRCPDICGKIVRTYKKFLTLASTRNCLG